MTREEAINTIQELMKACVPNSNYYIVGDMAIKALEQEPTTKDDVPENNVGNIEPTNKNDLGVDCIDRQAILDAIIKRLGISNESYLLPSEKTIYQQIKDMPSATPQEPRKGHWITRPHIYGVAFCSECGFELKINNTNYCSNCGADMSEVEE